MIEALQYAHFAWHLIEVGILMLLSLDYMSERDRRHKLDIMLEEIEEEEGPRVIS